MKTIDIWFAEYGESHQNRANKLIHWFCVPLIYFSIIALLSSIPVDELSSKFPAFWQPYAHLGTALVLLGLLFYLRISWQMMIGMFIFSSICLQIIVWIDRLNTPLWSIALTIFVGAWIGQFIGHKLEGKKPSFFNDLQFLMIGPAWLMGFIYRKLNIKY